MSCPQRPATRRRGEQLENAIFDAVLGELADVGYDRLTMEGVAARARTGKGALYRRWPSREALVLDALRGRLPSLDEQPDTGSVRGDLVRQLECMADTMRTPAGTAMWGILGNPQSNTAIVRAVHTAVIEPHQQVMLKILRQGVDRGEVRPAAVTGLVAQVGPVMIRQHYFSAGPPSSHAVREIVDEVVMPILRP
ncbi:MAG TPA: TetR/AcrR family transcriptional regulator [Streptosporangiaceae bacterium]|nr:TetR/AcrR family transcriptional regulator [Streptosporangiaceae bacterium]